MVREGLAQSQNKSWLTVVSIEIPIKDSSIPFLLCGICKEDKGRSRKFKSNLYNPIPRNGFRYSTNGRDYKNRAGISPTNVVIEGSKETTRDNLLKQVNNGVYIGRIWYTYAINGLAMGDFTSTIIADSFSIKDGKISNPLKPNTIRINTNIKHILNNIIGITKKKRSTLVWGSGEAVIAPEIAVSNVQLDNVTGFLD